jgi:pimeloyl-ACP methyl ester carboxylesterase
MTTYHHIEIEGLKIFYREAGAKDAPTILLLHGFPSSSHMYRDLIPKLADNFHVVAPDYPGFGYSDAPSPEVFTYTFDHLAQVIEQFIKALELNRFSIYIQDYGAPVGLRIASHHPDWIEAIITQNGNAYTEGLSKAFEPMKAYWAKRTEETEQPVKALLQRETTIFQYTEGANHPEKINPDAWTIDQFFLDRPGNHAIQLELLHNYSSNLALYPEWHAYFRKHQPPTLAVWGKNDPFFIPEGALAYKKDLQNIEVHLLNTGHFALEEECEAIADLIKKFLLSQNQRVNL